MLKFRSRTPGGAVRHRSNSAAAREVTSSDHNKHEARVRRTLTEIDSVLEPLLSDPTIQKLFRLFLLFTVKDNDDSPGIYKNAQTLHRDELWLMLKLMYSYMNWREPYRTDAAHTFDILCAEREYFTFKQMLLILPQAVPIERSVMAEVVTELYDELVNQIFHKDFLRRRCLISGAFKSFFCHVQPGKLQLFPMRKSNQPSREYLLNTATRVEANPKLIHGINLITVQRTTELQACSEIAKVQWIWAIRLAIERSASCSNYHHELFLSRHKRRTAQSQLSSPVRMSYISCNGAATPSSSSSRYREFTTDDIISYELHSIRLALKHRDEELALTQRKNQHLHVENGRLRELLTTENRGRRDDEITRMLALKMTEDERIRRELLDGDANTLFTSGSTASSVSEKPAVHQADLSVATINGGLSSLDCSVGNSNTSSPHFARAPRIGRIDVVVTNTSKPRPPRRHEDSGLGDSEFACNFSHDI